MSEKKASSRKLMLGLAILLVLIVVFFAPIIPYTYSVNVPTYTTTFTTVTDISTTSAVSTIPSLVTITKVATITKTVPETLSRSITLVDDKPTVGAGKAIYYRIYIDISNKVNNVVYVSVTETAGYDITLLVLDQKNFNSWDAGRSYVAYIEAKRVTSYSDRFVPDHSDYYYFVLDNTYSLFTNKVPQIKAVWSYTETSIKTTSETTYIPEVVYTPVITYVPQTVYVVRTVPTSYTTYIPESRTVYVSIFQILTGQLPK